MKKWIYILGISSLGLFASCDDALEAPTQSSFDETVIFANPVLAEGAVFSIYECFATDRGHRNRYLAYYGANSDLEWYNSHDDSEKNRMGNYDNFADNTQLASSSSGNGPWSLCYTAIERANICIQGIKKYGDPQPGNEMGYLYGEALTLRALFYNDLIKAWGDVPARFEPVTGTTIYVEKSDRDVIYKQLIADLGEAQNYIPWPGESAKTMTVERVNKAYVKALRAKICLAAAGYSQRPGENEPRRSNDPELTVAKLYPIAQQECQDIIDSKTCGLATEFVQVFKDNCQDVVTVGRESIFEIPFSDGRGQMCYTYAVRHDAADQYAGKANGGSMGPLPNVFYDFDEADTRRDVSCVPYKWGSATAGKSVQELSGGVQRWYFGKMRYEWMNRKFNGNDCGVNPIYMRYADVLLMCAEAANELGDMSVAVACMKEIRERAFPEDLWNEKVTQYLADADNSKEAMFNAIVNERAYEFCGEMTRKADLIRWNLLGDKLDEAKRKMTDLQQLSGEYADVPASLFCRMDGENIVIYGLNRGEVNRPSEGEWEKITWISDTKLTTVIIQSLYVNDPDTKQFWPIPSDVIAASRGSLKNDYNY